MRKRAAAILVSIWALTALPVLCTGGFIVHSCDCAQEGVFEHEVGCEDDPCSNLSVASRQRGDGSDVLPLPVIEGFRRPTSAGLLDTPAHPGVLLYRYGERPYLPFVPFDIPLLI